MYKILFKKLKFSLKETCFVLVCDWCAKSKKII